jgi:hypothetical protein
VAEVANEKTENDEIGEDVEQQRQTIGEIAFETDVKTADKGDRGRQRVMRGNQGVTPGQT